MGEDMEELVWWISKEIRRLEFLTVVLNQYADTLDSSGSCFIEQQFREKEAAVLRKALRRAISIHRFGE